MISPIWLTLASLVVALLSFWLRPVAQRWFQKKNEYEYLLKELGDIRRHLGANLKVMRYIAEDNVVPVPMHLNKLKIPESSAIFSIETLKLADFAYSSRLYELRLKLRNVNVEIEDLLTFSDPKYPADSFFSLLRYHAEKTEKLERMMQQEIKVLTYKFDFSPQESIVMRTIIPRPQAMQAGDGTGQAGARGDGIGPAEAADEGEAAEVKVPDSPDGGERPRAAE